MSTAAASRERADRPASRPAPSSDDSDWEGVRLHVVTGKGGTGKTTVAGALALALATGGRRTLLVEVEGRQGIAQLFDSAPLPYGERKVAAAAGGGAVYALAIDPQEALLEYLDLYYHLGRAGRALRRVGAIDFATTIAPGLRDVLLTGKAYEAVRRREGGAADAPYVYDAVVMDAPPTGRIARFLNVNTEVAGLARVGPIRRQADSIMGVIRSPRTAVHLVTLLEEMPVQETLDGIAELRAVRLPVGAIVVNMAREPLLPPRRLRAAAAGRLDRAELAAGIKAAGIDPDDALLTTLAAEATDHARKVSAERRLRAQLSKSGGRMYELPALDAIDRGALHTLAGFLDDQGAA